MTPRDLRIIHTTGNSSRATLPCMNMALLPQYFYLLLEKPVGRHFQVWSPYYQAAQCYQKTPISVSSRWQVRYEKARKASKLMTATTSVHLPKQVSTYLTIKHSWQGGCGPPFLRHPPFDPTCLYLCVPFPLFCSTFFQGILDSSPHPYPNPSCTNPTNQPFLV